MLLHSVLVSLNPKKMSQRRSRFLLIKNNTFTKKSKWQKKKTSWILIIKAKVILLFRISEN
jgi:hypothetical protein